MVILENNSIKIIKKDFYYFITILSGNPSNQDWFEFKNFLKQVYSKYDKYSFAFVFDFSQVNSNTLSISSFLEIILFFKQNRTTTLKVLIATVFFDLIDTLYFSSICILKVIISSFINSRIDYKMK